MKTRLYVILLLLTSFTASARNFSEQLSEGSLMVFEVRDVPALQDTWQQSPLGMAWQEFSAQKPMMAFIRAVAAEDKEEALALDEIEEVMVKVKERQAEINTHLDGSMIFALGDLTGAIATFKDTKAKREALYNGFDGAGEANEDQWEAMLKQEEEFDALEMAAVARELKVFVEVKDGEALMTKISGWIEEMIQEQAGDTADEVEFTTEDWDGTTLYKIASKDPEEAIDKVFALSWAVQDGVWTFALTRDALIENLDQLKNIPQRSLAGSQVYQESLQELGEVDMMFYMNIAQVDKLIRTSIEPESLNQPVAPNRKSPAEYLDWLALDAVLPYAVGMKMQQDSLNSILRMGFSRETALSRILIDPSEAPAPTPPFVHKDFSQVSTLNWNLGGFLRRLETELTALDPQVPMMLAMGKGFATAQLGMDVQMQLLDQLDNGVIVAQEMDPDIINKIMIATVEEDAATLMDLQQKHPTSGQNTLIALQLKDPQVVSGAINTLLSRMHPTGIPEPEMYKDHPVHNPIPPTEGDVPAGLMRFTYLDNYLLLAVGDPSLVHKAISASQDGSLRLWQQPEYQDTRAVLPEGMGTDYVKEDVQKMLVNMMSAGIKAVFEDASALPDFSKVAETLADAISVTTRQGTVFTTRSVLRFAEPK